MAKDPNENSLDNNSQDESTELFDAEEDIDDNVTDDITSIDEDGDIDADTTDDITSTDKEDQDIKDLQPPQTKKLISNNLILIFIGIAALGIIVGAYFWISAHKKRTSVDQVPFETKAPDTAKQIPVPLLPQSSKAPETTGAVAAPKVTTTSTVKAPTPPLLSPSKIIEPKKDDDVVQNNIIPKKAPRKQSKRAAKIKSSIMLKSSTDSKQKTDKDQTLTSASADGTFTPSITKASATKVTKIGNMSNVITQGKILDAVLETPINTLYPGPIRAVISRDVFSEKGYNVLIPKGTRIIGSLKGGYTPSSARVTVSWTRVILHNGYDIEITSAPGVGKLGMMGIEGVVNRQFIETVGSAALLSILNIGAAKIIEDQFDIDSNSSISSTSSSGTITTTSSQTPTQQAAETAVTDLSDTTQDWLTKNFLPTPYIVVNQGTRVKVFVNQDIRFPSNLNGSNFIK